MIRQARLTLSVLAACAATSAALADPPVAATIPQPVPATIPQPAGTTVSQATVSGAAPSANYGSLADTRMICKSEAPTGSRLGGHRTCMTKADWEKQSRSAQDYLNTRIGAPSASK